MNCWTGRSNAEPLSVHPEIEFDIKPGTYLVRMVVRDAEGAQMAARNGP